MKKIKFFAYAGAIALLSTGFVACSSTESEVADNPNYNPETNSVKTQLVLNIATANTPTTRMTSANTQATSSDGFRGISDVSLLTYELPSGSYTLTTAGGGSHVWNTTTEALATAKRKYSLGDLLYSGEISESNSRRVMELALPVNTNALMFYGKAPRSTTGTNKTLGSVTMDVKENALNTKFTINPRMTSANRIIFNETAALFSLCMNMLTNAALKQYTAGVDGAARNRDLRYAFYWPIINETTDILTLNNLTADEKAALPANGAAGTGDHASQTFYIGEMSWPELGRIYAVNNDGDSSNDEAALTPNQEILGQAFVEFTTMRTVGGKKELRAGSGPALQAVVSDLYSVASRVSNAQPSFPQGEIAVLLAKRIKTIIETCFINNGSGGLLNYRDLETVTNAVVSNVYGQEATSYSHVTSMSNFPNNIDMPEGAAIIKYVPAAGTTPAYWEYETSIPAYGMSSNPAGSQDINKYLFPAELMYFGNSPVRVTDDSHETAHYPQTVGTWDTDGTWATGELAGATGWTKDGKVKSTTRSVAMQKDINYGTALLKSTVKYASGLTTLKDNNAAIQAERLHVTEPNADVPIIANGFRLKGILIGGAAHQVGWNYLMKESSFDYIVYDNDIPSTVIPDTPGTASQPVYTLLWDNWNSSLAATAQSPVYIALELENNNVDFWGGSNRIRKGCTFYLVGKLDPTASSFPDRTQTNYNLPPYAADGTTVGAVRVFIQDYMTTADFTIGETSLQNAYVTVPDLRSSEISLGLSVDIKWETGLTFSDVILGKID